MTGKRLSGRIGLRGSDYFAPPSTFGTSVTTSPSDSAVVVLAPRPLTEMAWPAAGSDGLNH